MPENHVPRILIVDDREQNRYILRRVLERSGYKCEESGTGRDALERSQTLPDAVILDVHLPDISGFEVCQKIKSDPRTAQVPVLQVSASFVGSEDRAKALEIGADAYLTHPIDGIVLIATVRSLLRLRAAENVTRKSAAQWQSASDALSEGLAFVDNEGHLAQMNKAFATICGLRCSCERNAGAAEVFEQVFGTSEPLRHEGPERFSAEFQVGQKLIAVTVDALTLDGVLIGRTVVLTDITDRKLAEYAMRTADKLAATGKLAHAIAHEINNPLEALTNLIYLARTAASRADVRQFLSSAEVELARIGRVTKQSLSFYRDTIRAVPVDIGSIVEEVVALYEKVAATRHVEVSCELRPALTIDGFPGQLRQIFANLIRNAIEAAPSDSKVTIRVRPTCRLERHGTLVTIHDCGAGISKDVRERIFDPFFTTKELKGSGMGLWVTHALLSKHQGTLRFRTSTRDGASGTTFAIFLPLGGVEPGKSEDAA